MYIIQLITDFKTCNIVTLTKICCALIHPKRITSKPSLKRVSIRFVNFFCSFDVRSGRFWRIDVVTALESNFGPGAGFNGSLISVEH